MPIAQVGNWTSAQFAASTGGSLTGRTSTAGNHVVIGYSTDDASSPSVTHSQAGTVQVGRAHESGGADNYGTRYVENIVGGASHTITITTAANKFTALHATEYSGIATSGSLDKTANGTGTDTTSPFDLTSGATATTTQADELAVGVGGIATNLGSGTWTAQGGYTLRGNTVAGNVSSVSCLVDLVLTATGTPAAAARLTDASGLGGGTGQWLIQTVTFKAAVTATPAYSPPAAPFLGPGSQGPLAWQWRQQVGVDATTVANDVSVVGLLPLGAALVADATHAATVAGILPVGAVPVATVSHAANVAGILPLGATPVATFLHDAAVAGILPLGATPVALMSHDATVVGILPLGAVQVAITQLQVPTIGLLPVGATLVGSSTHDALVAGILPVGVVPVAPISHDATVAGILPVGASLVAPVSHNASVAGILPVGAVLVALVTGAADISVVGVLTVGASLVASVSHQALVAGVLPLGTALVAPVSHTAAVTGILPVGLSLVGDVAHHANVVGILPVGAVLVAFVGDAPVIVYPTAFEVLANWHLGVDINPSNLTVELLSSSLFFAPDASGLLLPLTPSNENLDLQ